jgi:hypothetical protein
LHTVPTDALVLVFKFSDRCKIQCYEKDEKKSMNKFQRERGNYVKKIKYVSFYLTRIIYCIMFLIKIHNKIIGRYFMSKKVTISVPDDLSEKMEKWRDHFNFSQVFQDAISSLIQKKEEFQKRLKGDHDMDAIVERLKREKSETEKNYFDDGKKDGLEWAKAAHYSDLQSAIGWEFNKGDDPRQCPDSDIADYFSEIIDEDPILHCEDYDNYANDALVSFIAGWKEGVEEFWNEIADKI